MPALRSRKTGEIIFSPDIMSYTYVQLVEFAKFMDCDIVDIIWEANYAFRNEACRATGCMKQPVRNGKCNDHDHHKS